MRNKTNWEQQCRSNDAYERLIWVSAGEKGKNGMYSNVLSVLAGAGGVLVLAFGGLHGVLVLVSFLADDFKY